MVTVAVPQLSVAVNIAAAGTLSQDAETSAGADDKTGAVRSLTVTVCEAELVFPHKSVAVQMRVKT
jgi:hypothetical protein